MLGLKGTSLISFSTTRLIQSMAQAAVFVVSLGLSAAHAQTYSLGAVADPDVYGAVPKSAPLARGDYLSAPSEMSLKRFVPPVGDQGQQGSCVGWATAYAARTLLSAKDMEVDSSSRLRNMVLSPAYVFNQIHQPGCNGSYVAEALTLMQRQGVSLLSDFPYDEYSCTAQPSSSVRDKASAFRIKGYSRLWGGSGRNKHVATRRALANGNPVVIVMGVGEGFMRHSGSGTWQPSSTEWNELRSNTLGAHAMTVIGYDDTREGGAFEVVNSWSSGWGNRGFFWISYEDFNAFVYEGYEVLPPDPPPPPRVVDMGGSARVLHISGDALDVTRTNDGYRLRQPLPSGTRFRVEASSQFNGALYVIGGDASGDYVTLFPRGDRVTPYTHSGTTLLLPGPTEQHFTRLNDTVGTDYYVLLYTQEPLDAQAVAARMARASGSVAARLRSALGNRLVPQDEMELLASGIGFEADSGDADVAAVVLSIDHVAADPAKDDSDAPLIVLTDPAPEAFDSDDTVIPVPSRLFRLEGMAQDQSEIASLKVEGALSSRYSSRGPFRAEIELPEGPGPHPISIETRDAAGNTARRTFQFSLTFN